MSAIAPTVQMDRNFLPWLKNTGTSLLVSSYKTHKVIALGWFLDTRDNNEKLSIWLTDFVRPLGIAHDKSSDTVYVNSMNGIWKHVNAGEFEATQLKLGTFSHSYMPRKIYVGGDIDAHDIAIGADGTPYFCSALFNCVGKPSETHSLSLYWSPPWISNNPNPIAEDRCHLNGLCCRDGVPRYVTSVSKSDVHDGWKENRVNKGVVYDIVNNIEVCKGLTMPHSPRWYNDRLWILESGTGYFGYIDLEKHEFVRCVFIPSFLRGLSFIKSGNNTFAIIGGSKDRHELTFADLPLGKNIEEKEVSVKCGIWIVNLKNNNIVTSIYFESPIDEIYDVCAMEGIRRPMIMDLETSNLSQSIENLSIAQ